MPCANCGAKIDSSACFCSKCGMPIDTALQRKKDPNTTIIIDQKVGTNKGGQVIGAEIGTVEGDLTVELEKAVVSGDIIGRDKITNYIMNVDPNLMNLLAEKMIKLLKIDQRVVQASSVESPPPHVDEQIHEIDEAQLQIEAQGFSPTAETSYNLGMLAAYRRDYATALAHFSRAVQQNPEYKQAYKSLAWLQQSLANHELYQRSMDKAINRLTAARSAIDALLRLDPLDVEALTLRGYIYKTQGQAAEVQGKSIDKQAHYTEAARMFEHAVRLDPTDASVRNGLGNVQYAMGNFDAAIAAYSRAVELNPMYTAAFHDLALAYEQKLEIDGIHAKKWCRKALEAWKKTYQLAPDDPGFTADYILTIGQRVSWLEGQCG